MLIIVAKVSMRNLVLILTWEPYCGCVRNTKEVIFLMIFFFHVLYDVLFLALPYLLHFKFTPNRKYPTLPLLPYTLCTQQISKWKRSPYALQTEFSHEGNWSLPLMFQLNKILWAPFCMDKM